MALDEEVWRSNLGCGSEIERLRVKGARAAAACRSSSKSTLRGSNRVGIWPGTVRAIRGNHLGQEWDTGVLRAALATAAAVLGVGNPPACGILAVAMAYRLLELTQERGEVGVCSPRAWGGRIARRREPAARSGRRRRRGVRGGVVAGVSGLLDSLGSPPGVAAEMLQGSGWEVVYRR